MEEKQDIYRLLSRLLHQESLKGIYFEEIIQEIFPTAGAGLVLRVVPQYIQEKKSFFTYFFAATLPTVRNYALAFGSSDVSYATPDELKKVFEKKFASQAQKKAEELCIPLVRIFLRKGAAIDTTIMEQIASLNTYWALERKLGKTQETITYFMLGGKLIRVDSEIHAIHKRNVLLLSQKLLQSYPNLLDHPGQFRAFHEIFLSGEGHHSFLLPNTNELLTDVDKEKIRQAFLHAPDSPKEFAQKLELLLTFHIPLLSQLQEEETHLYPHMLQGSVFEFIVGLHSVVRWSRQPEEVVDPKTGKKSIMLPFQNSRDPKVVETDLDHTIRMLTMATPIFTTPQYPALAKALDEKMVMNGIFVHDGGEPFSPFGDVTHADEARWQQLRASKDAAENAAYTSWWQNRMQLRGLREDILEDLYGSFTAEQKGDSSSAIFVKFLDHFQAVQYGIEHIYPYEAVYKDTGRLEEFVQKYALIDLAKVMRHVTSAAQEDLKHFFMDQLPFSLVEKAYKEAVGSGRLDKKSAAAFVHAIEKTLNKLYQSKSVADFLNAIVS